MNHTGGEWELLSIDRSQALGLIVRCKFKCGAKRLIIDIDVDDREGVYEKYSAWLVGNEGAFQWIFGNSRHADELGVPALVEKYEPIARMMLL